MRLISFLSVAGLGVVLYGCPSAPASTTGTTSNCQEGQQCGQGGSGNPSGSSVGTGSGSGVGGSGGSGAASTTSGAGGSGGAANGSGGSAGSGSGGSAGSGSGGSGGAGGGGPVDPCIELIAVLEEALSAAQECVVGSDMSQCDIFLDGICCQVVVNGDQTAILTYQAALEAAEQANCPCPLPPPVDCQVNPSASCVADSETTGHCEIDPPP